MDTSLYHLALRLKQPPQPMSVMPATLLSLVGSTFDLLLEEKLLATLWVKLPPGEIWLSEIQRYHKQAEATNDIYNCCFGQKAKLINSGNDKSSVVPVELAPDSQLRREYFLLVFSPQFCSLILARRPLPGQHQTIENSERQTTKSLLAINSFEGQVIKRVLDGIKQAASYSALKNNTATKSSPELANLLANWDSLFTVPPTRDFDLLNQLLAKQIQQNDEIRRTDTIDRAKKKLKQQNKKLLQSLSLKDEFLNNLCQELRTPLTNMKTALSLVNSAVTLKQTQRQRYMDMLNTECDRQSSLIIGVLALVQLERVAEQSTLQPVLLSDIVPGVVSTYQPLAQERGIMLAYTVPENLPVVSCLNSWLKQIVINLLHNSIKFTPKGGQVWVRARQQGDYVQLEFRDTGIGITTSDIPKIFDRFYSVRPAVGEDISGAGLGLTIVQEILRHCGGSISVKSRLGEGSIFNVFLPLFIP